MVPCREEEDPGLVQEVHVGTAVAEGARYAIETNLANHVEGLPHSLRNVLIIKVHF